MFPWFIVAALAAALAGAVVVVRRLWRSNKQYKVSEQNRQQAEARTALYQEVETLVQAANNADIEAADRLNNMLYQISGEQQSKVRAAILACHALRDAHELRPLLDAAIEARSNLPAHIKALCTFVDAYEPKMKGYDNDRKVLVAQHLGVTYKEALAQLNQLLTEQLRQYFDDDNFDEALALLTNVRNRQGDFSRIQGLVISPPATGWNAFVARHTTTPPDAWLLDMSGLDIENAPIWAAATVNGRCPADDVRWRAMVALRAGYNSDEVKRRIGENLWEKLADIMADGNSQIDD